MSWRAFVGSGQPHSQSVEDITHELRSERGVIEIQTWPAAWEDLLRRFAESRPVTTEVVEDRASFTTVCRGRVVRFYAHHDITDDYRFRVVEK